MLLRDVGTRISWAAPNQYGSDRVLRQRFADSGDLTVASAPAVRQRLDIRGSTPAHSNDRENRSEPLHRTIPAHRARLSRQRLNFPSRAKAGVHISVASVQTYVTQYAANVCAGRGQNGAAPAQGLQATTRGSCWICGPQGAWLQARWQLTTTAIRNPSALGPGRSRLCLGNLESTSEM